MVAGMASQNACAAEEVEMRQEFWKGPASPWKHKAKVLAAFLALCLFPAFSGIGLAADHAAHSPAATVFSTASSTTMPRDCER